jgi:ABC-type antimicrobial peptide transport system permease subunit
VVDVQAAHASGAHAAAGAAPLVEHDRLAPRVLQRTREIGIRMALGARPRDVLRMVMRQGLLLGGIGATVGVLLTLYGARFLSSLLYGVRPIDPVTLGGVVVLVLGITTAACLAPAMRALGTNPVRTLRGD